MLNVYEAENVILPKIELHKFIFVYGIDGTILIVSSETTFIVHVVPVNGSIILWSWFGVFKNEVFDIKFCFNILLWIPIKMCNSLF